MTPVKSSKQPAKKKSPAPEQSATPHKWEFKARFHRNAFGWKSEPAITRIRQAVTEIKKVAKQEPVLAAEGAIAFLERVSAALGQVDGSSGAMGGAVNDAIAELVPIIASATVDAKVRSAWLEQLWEARKADKVPYIEHLEDHWGTLCASKSMASDWADRLLESARAVLRPRPRSFSSCLGTSCCLSALLAAGRYDELLALLKQDRDPMWQFRQFGVRALCLQGRKAEALRYAEEGRAKNDDPWEIAGACEEILLSSGLTEEAYQRYGLAANRRTTYLATYRAVSKKYPHKAAAEILADLVKTTPGQEGKWFAAAKSAGLFAEALELAQRTPCDPKTLTRAARDFMQKAPAFAVGAGLAALHWLVQGYGYEITSEDAWASYETTLVAAARIGNEVETKEAIRNLVAAETARDQFMTKVLGAALGLPVPKAPARSVRSFQAAAQRT